MVARKLVHKQKKIERKRRREGERERKKKGKKRDKCELSNQTTIHTSF